MFGRNCRLVSSELCEYIWKRSFFIVAGIAFLVEILIALSYSTPKYSIGIQTKEYLAHISPGITSLLLVAYAIIIFSLRKKKVFRKGFEELIKGNFNYILDVEQYNAESELSTTGVQIGTYMQKLSHEIEETSKEIREIRNYLEVITIESHDAIFIADEMGKIEYGNESFLHLSGFMKEDIIGRNLNTLFFPYNECSDKLIQSYTQNCDNKQLDIDLILKTGEKKRVSVRYAYVELNSKKKLVHLIKDISDIQMINEIKNSIVSNISHELRTPLTIVKGFIEIASEEENREERNKYLQRSLEALKRQEWMIEDLLEVAMDEEDIRSIVYDCVHLYDVVEMSVEKVLPKALEADIDIKNMIKRGMCVKADPDKLCYAMTKLLDNAVKFNNPGEEVIIEAVSSEYLITVKIVDRGIGIPPEDLDRVFERFYQKDSSSKRRYSGNGLGLTIAKRIIEHHGGKIWAESEKNKGSTFFFTLNGFPEKHYNSTIATSYCKNR
jgi:two-component system sensor histidine kinase VicK